jgi:hypothetical protein
MNAETFAIWMERQGHSVLRSASSYWYRAGPRVYQAFPYHWLIQPSERELRNLMVRHGVAALRYSTPLDAQEGIASYHAVLYGEYNLDMLRSQARNGVKSGLKRFTTEPIPFRRLAEEGWLLQKDTLERQGRTESMTQEEWQRLCLAAEGLPGFEAWGALQEGELAGALLATRVDDTCYVPYAASRSRFLNQHVNNALFYTVCTGMLAREGVAGIFFCLHSLDAPPSVDEFKFRMSFIAKPVRQRVVFHPLLQPLARRSVYDAVVHLQQRRPESYLLSKAEGMLRFHLLGKSPLEQQEWPACLSVVKEKMFAG